MKLSDWAQRQGLEERTARRWAASGKVLAEKRNGCWYVATSDASYSDTDGGPPITLTIRCRSISEASLLLAQWRTA